MFLDLRDNLKSSGSSLHECSISYSTLKGSFAPRIPTTTSAAALNTTKPNTTTKREKAPDAQLSPEAAALSAAPKVPVMMISASRFHTKHAQAWSRMTRRPRGMSCYDMEDEHDL